MFKFKRGHYYNVDNKIVIYCFNNENLIHLYKLNVVECIDSDSISMNDMIDACAYYVAFKNFTIKCMAGKRVCSLEEFLEEC